MNVKLACKINNFKKKIFVYCFRNINNFFKWNWILEELNLKKWFMILNELKLILKCNNIKSKNKNFNSRSKRNYEICSFLKFESFLIYKMF
jgi:hypothetical protein